MLTRKPKPSAVPHCAWSTPTARCPTSQIKDRKSQKLITELADGSWWCAFHKPAEWTEETRLDDLQRIDLLTRLVAHQVEKYHLIALPGFCIPGGFEVSPFSVCGKEMPPGWSQNLTSINIRGARISGDVGITNCSTKQSLELMMDDTEVEGSVVISATPGAHFRGLEFRRLRATSLSIIGVDPLATKAELICAEDSTLSGNMQLANMRISDTLEARGAIIASGLRLQGCIIGRSLFFDGDMAPGDPIDALFKNVVALEDSRAGRSSAVGQLVVDACVLHGSLGIGATAINHFLQLSRTRLDGIVQCGRAELPKGSVIFELDQGVGLDGLATSSRKPSSELPHERARMRRSFGILRGMAADPDQRARLLRGERKAVRAVHSVPLSKRCIWALHEYLTDSGANWAHPAALLLAQAIFFWMLMATSIPGNTLAHAAAVSAANSFAPFLSLESLVHESSLSEVFLSFLQSAISAGLISSAVLAIRSDMEQEAA